MTPPQLPEPAEQTAEVSCRVFAAQALGRIGAAAAAALPDLRDATRYAPDPVRQAALAAVRQIEGA